MAHGCQVDREWLRNAYETEGLTDAAIGTALGISGRSVGGWRSRFGIPTRDRHTIAERREARIRSCSGDTDMDQQALSLYRGGMSLGEVGDIIGRSPSGVRKMVARAGGELRRRSDAGRLAAPKRDRGAAYVFLHDPHLLTSCYWAFQMSLTDIAECCSVDTTTVHRHMQQLGIPCRGNSDAMLGRNRGKTVKVTCRHCGKVDSVSVHDAKRQFCNKGCYNQAQREGYLTDRANDLQRNGLSADHVSRLVAANRKRLDADYIYGSGKRLRDLRMRAGLTQIALGKRIGISGSFVANYESDRYGIHRSRVGKWEQACAMVGTVQEGRFRCACGYATNSRHGWAGHGVNCVLGGSYAQKERDRWFSHGGGRGWTATCRKRDNWTCQRCGKRFSPHAKDVLHVHHKAGYAEYPELRSMVSNGITLCIPCHREKGRGIHSNAGRAQREAWEAEALAELGHLLTDRAEDAA